MASPTEFYLTTMWPYKPKTVKRVMDDLMGMKLDRTEFTYDNEYHWFKVLCPTAEAAKIRQHFGAITREIEEDIFERDENDILNPDGSLKLSFDNEWIRGRYDQPSAEAFADIDKSYSLPAVFSGFPHTAIWDELDKNDETVTIRNIVTRNQFDQISNEAGVTLSHDLRGRLVYIGGSSQEAICKAKEKLSIMLTIKKFSTTRPQTEHLVYAEGYTDDNVFVFTADIRYLANIDPRLVSSTILDPATVNNLENAYRTLYREGASIRLCLWAADKQCRLPLLGPKVVPRPKLECVLGNRPIISVKSGAPRLDESSPPGPAAAAASENQRSHRPSTDSDCQLNLLNPPKPTTNSAKTATSSPSLKSGIQWGMAPLIPLPTHGETPGDGETDPLKPLPVPSARPVQARKRFPSDAASCLPAAGVADRKEGALMPSGQLPAMNDFATEIEAAMARLLSSVPYRRGSVALRAEFGRVILANMDFSGLAFNDANTESKGWKKGALIRELNAHYGRGKHLHFTKILSTYGRDVEDMVNTKSYGARLWQQNPDRAWTTYSFHCTLRHAQNPGRLIIDVEDDGTPSKSLAYQIRQDHGRRGTDGLLPIYVHAIRRNWDMRIVLSHVKTDDMQQLHGSFAKALVQSLSVLRNGTGAPELKFAVHDSFAVEVHDVRVLTKWRHSSLNSKSVLEITEVEQLEIHPGGDGADGGDSGSKDGWKTVHARPWTERTRQQKRPKGEVLRWYEAAVVSPDSEALFRQNESLGLGERVDWDAQALKARGIFFAIYGPALQTLVGIDHVGGNDDNGLSKAYGPLLLRANNPPRSVPGNSSVQPKGKQQRRKAAPSDESDSDTASTRSTRAGSTSSDSGGVQFW